MSSCRAYSGKLKRRVSWRNPPLTAGHAPHLTPSLPPSRVLRPPLPFFAPQEIKNLSMSLNSLKVAQARFTESANSLAAIPADSEGACGPTRARAAPRARRATPALAPRSARAGREALIPLTPSLFVPATLGGSAEGLVDIGTGFFVSKSSKEAALVMGRKAEMVRGQLEGLGDRQQQLDDTHPAQRPASPRRRDRDRCRRGCRRRWH